MKQVWVWLLCLCLWCCESSTPSKVVTPAIYYWKTIFQLSPFEQSVLTQNNIKKIYVKYFDIDLDERVHKPTFKAPLIPKQAPPKSCEIVPVVYITNRTLQQLDIRYLEAFSKKIFQKIQQINSLWITNQLISQEVQIDCDWTLSTQKKYFGVLKFLRKQNPNLSATIRLHQVKYAEKTGVPPVTRGMLMCYNMADWQKNETPNSIFDPKVLSQYIGNLSAYPLPLDLALPAYYWTIAYRNKQFLYFLNATGTKDFEKLTYFKKSDDKASKQYIALKDTLAWGIQIRKGDVFRVEEVAFDDLLKGSKLLSTRIPNQKLTFALYHLDQKSLNYYTHEQIKKLYYP
ncbi:hypothetical protein [Flectobacillus major]|uniref:hypothetical protein n=1 Tax=Flectobacillus major TaxID=103 RepID=UPI0003F7DC9B|nr:hypothetical protein [Flectobacillus major]